MSLLQRFSLKKKKPEKSLFKKTILRNKDLVYPYPEIDIRHFKVLLLIRDDYLFSIRGDPLEIDPLNSIVFFRRVGKLKEDFSGECWSYEELKDSINQQYEELKNSKSTTSKTFLN